MKVLKFDKEIYFCTDIETSGTSFATGSIMSIGMVVVYKSQANHYVIHERDFYVRLHPRLKPDGRPYMDIETMEWWNQQDPEALQETFYQRPRSKPDQAIQDLNKWVDEMCRAIPGDITPVMVSAPVSFDGSFITNYLTTYSERETFGRRYIDLKSFVMGITGLPHGIVTRDYISDLWGVAHTCSKANLQHHALYDAEQLAIVWKNILNDQLETHG